MLPEEMIKSLNEKLKTMNRSIVAVCAAFLLLTTLSSCEKIDGEGAVITQSRSVGAIQSVSLAMSADVYYTPGDVYSLTISGQENILHEILTLSEGDRLVVRVREGVVLGRHKPVTVRVTAPTMRGMNISGSGTIFATGPIDPEALNLVISGSGSIRLDSVYARQISADISGSGSMNAAGGTTDLADTRISGSGTIDFRHIRSARVYTSTSGSGDTYVYADSLLEATISGSGSVWYRGTPELRTHISGSGTVRKL